MKWWFEHQDEVTDAFLEAAEQGELGHGTVARIIREQAARREAGASVEVPFAPNDDDCTQQLEEKCDSPAE